MRLALLFALLVALRSSAAEPVFHPRSEHVVLVVWDGMRPDFITAEAAPTLHALAKSGTIFNDNHSVYITSTEVNGAAIATGCYPNRNGILANREYRPDIDPLRPFATENAAAIRKGDELRAGKYIRVPTIAELVQRTGQRTAVAGTKPVALLHDRAPDKSASNGSVILFAGQSFPEQAAKDFAAALGAFPEYPLPGTLEPNTAQNAWTTKALVQELWKDGVPKFSTLWLGDPDFSQHLTQPGSPTALAAIRDSDTNLAAVLAALDAKGARDKTDVFIVSDHAFSTVDRTVELTSTFASAGFTVRREYKAATQPGEVLLINLGGSNQLYVPGHDPALIKAIVEFLQTTDFAGPIFTRDALPGTFALRDARLDSPDSADIVFSFRWRDEKNRWGIPGTLTAEMKKPGYGTHASLSRFDIHNTLVAAGPDIRAGFTDELPSGNVDVAPTILRILGLTPPEPQDGRVLFEALAGVDWQPPKPETKMTEATAAIGSAKWRQYLKLTTLGDRVYLDEGNASGER
ncbi:MAG TPA: alkaline phosphatase family protein [Chthoniobacteraceae bacterium]|nr:alkaline phosphatase family protein [Chthoniobacteraceae bacterium]